MKLKQIEEEALKLSDEERIKLVEHLMSSLTTSQQNDAWAEVLTTAQVRAQQIDSGEVETVAYSSVMEKARAMVR